MPDRQTAAPPPQRVAPGLGEQAPQRDPPDGQSTIRRRRNPHDRPRRFASPYATPRGLVAHHLLLDFSCPPTGRVSPRRAPIAKRARRRQNQAEPVAPGHKDRALATTSRRRSPPSI